MFALPACWFPGQDAVAAKWPVLVKLANVYHTPVLRAGVYLHHTLVSRLGMYRYLHTSQ